MPRKISPALLEEVKQTIEDRKKIMASEGWADFEYIDEHNEVRPNLYLGSHPHDIDKFQYVFAFNGRPTYYVGIGKLVICRPFNDCEQMPDIEMLHDTAELVLKYSIKGPTLVHCAAGINRSALITALALIKDGMKPVDAIALIRQKRSKMCLSNKTFEQWLLSLDEGPHAHQKHGNSRKNKETPREQ